MVILKCSCSNQTKFNQFLWKLLLSNRHLEFLHGASNNRPHFTIHLARRASHDQIANRSSGNANVLIAAHDWNFGASQNDASLCHVFNGELDFTSRTWRNLRKLVILQQSIKKTLNECLFCLKTNTNLNFILKILYLNFRMYISY